jgi:hypothetical protein
LELKEWWDLSAWWDQWEAQGSEPRVAWAGWERMVASDLTVLLDSEDWTAHRPKEP